MNMSTQKKRNRKWMIADAVLWFVTLVPLVVLMAECVRAFVNGTTHGLQSDVVLYGIPAFVDTFNTRIAGEGYLFFWIPVAVITCLFTLFVVIRNRRDRNM